jgi:hypothetical protein
MLCFRYLKAAGRCDSREEEQRPNRHEENPVINSLSVSSRPRRRQRRRQRQPEFYAGQRLEITRYPWQTSATRLVEIEDVREISHAAINPSIPPSYLYHLRGENGSLTLMYYCELRRRVVEAL